MERQMFEIEFQVYYHEVNPREEATPLTILHFLEDAAIAHSESVGYGVSRLRSEQRAWVLNRWHLHMERYPVYGEKVIIETWPSNFERFYATREFRIISQNQELMGRATSLWILMNTNSKRPLRIGPEFKDAYGLESLRAIEDSFKPLQFAESCEDDWEKEQVFQVRRSDIDTNGHVNNVNYLQWMLEVIPQEIYQAKQLVSLEIIYKKETTYGSSIRSRCSVKSPRNVNSECWQLILDDEGHELAIARTMWNQNLTTL